MEQFLQVIHELHPEIEFIFSDEELKRMYLEHELEFMTTKNIDAMYEMFLDIVADWEGRSCHVCSYCGEIIDCGFFIPGDIKDCHWNDKSAIYCCECCKEVGELKDFPEADIMEW